MLTGKLETFGDFGAVGAEDDQALLSYFLSTPAVSSIESGRISLVLGRKGSGKTALVRYFADRSSEDTIHIAMRLGQYPWGVHAQRNNSGSSDIEKYASSWRYLVAVRTISSLVGRFEGVGLTKEARIARKFLLANYENEEVSVQSILTPSTIKFESATVGAKVFSLIGGTLEWKRAAERPDVGLLVDRIATELFRLAGILADQIGVKQTFLHFGELDLGLQQLTEERRLLLIGLVVASRSIRKDNTGKFKIFPNVYLRTDIWDDIDFSDKNKIAENLSHEIVWSSSSLRRLIDERIRTKLGEGEDWESIHDSNRMRGTQPKWDYIIARTFLRPRDVIAYLNAVLAQARLVTVDRPLITKDDVYDARPSYSRYLRNELHEEISPHWPKWEAPLRACSAIATLVIKRGDFDKVFDLRSLGRGDIDRSEALEKLFGYSVIGYRRGLPSGGTEWVFQYEKPNLQWDPLSTQIKVHQGLKEYFGLSEKSGDS